MLFVAAAALEQIATVKAQCFLHSGQNNFELYLTNVVQAKSFVCMLLSQHFGSGHFQAIHSTSLLMAHFKMVVLKVPKDLIPPSLILVPVCV